MPKSLSTLEIRANLADIGLVGFSSGSVAWEGDHVRLVLLLGCGTNFSLSLEDWV